MKVTTIAGTAGVAAFQDGTLYESLFHHPSGLCLDGEGGLLVADRCNNRIRRIDLDAGIVTTIAGFERGFQDGFALVEAKFNCPTSLVIHGDTVYVTDSGNGAIRRIRSGMVSTLANVPSNITSIAVGDDGSILISDIAKCSIERIDPKDGSIQVFPRRIPHPMGITVSPNGIVYVSTLPGCICYWSDGDWKVLIETNEEIRGPRADPFGNLLFLQGHCIKKVDPSSGNVRLLAGSQREVGKEDGSLLEARFYCPIGIEVNDSSIFVSDYFSHSIRSIRLLRPWRKGSCILSSYSLFRKPFLVPSIDERGDTNGCGPVEQEGNKGGSSERSTEGRAIHRL